MMRWIQLLTDELETVRELHIQRSHKKEVQTVVLPLARQKECQVFLKRPDLINRINELIGKAGVVGEVNNRLLLSLWSHQVIKCRRLYTPLSKVQAVAERPGY